MDIHTQIFFKWVSHTVQKWLMATHYLPTSLENHHQNSNSIHSDSFFPLFSIASFLIICHMVLRSRILPLKIVLMPFYQKRHKQAPGSHTYSSGAQVISVYTWAPSSHLSRRCWCLGDGSLPPYFPAMTLAVSSRNGELGLILWELACGFPSNLNHTMLMSVEGT